LGSLFVQRYPLTPLANKEIKDRYEKLRESLRTLGEEQEAVNSEGERIRGEMDRLDRLVDEIETATDADRERIEREFESQFESQFESLRSKGEAFLERQRSLEKATTEMDEEVSAVERLFSGYLEQLTTAIVEGEKLYFEVYKLIATLATGTIVAVAAITAVLEPAPNGILMFAFAVLLLLASISGSVSACLSSAERVRQGLMPDSTPQSDRSHLIITFFTIGTLVLGVFLSSLFLSTNVDRLPGVADPPPPTQPSENTTSTTLGE
jgi:hypothetical protein